MGGIAGVIGTMLVITGLLIPQLKLAFLGKASLVSGILVTKQQNMLSEVYLTMYRVKQDHGTGSEDPLDGFIKYIAEDSDSNKCSDNDNNNDGDLLDDVDKYCILTPYFDNGNLLLKDCSVDTARDGFDINDITTYFCSKGDPSFPPAEYDAPNTTVTARIKQDNSNEDLFYVSLYAENKLLNIEKKLENIILE